MASARAPVDLHTHFCRLRIGAMRNSTWITAIILLVSSTAQATIINVPADSTTIQGGINGAAPSDTVLVQPGRYVENINYNGKGIVLGSLLLTTGDTSYISQTIIDGDSSGSVVTYSSGEDSTAVLLGFTIANGQAVSGGGIYCNYNSSPSLESLRVSGNSATSWGGGIYCDGHSSPSLLHVTINGNSVEVGNGGGIVCRHGSNVSMVQVLVTGNTASGYAGGLCFRGDSNPSLVNVTVSGNMAASYGGGVYCGNYSYPVLVNTILWNNAPLEIYLEPGSLLAATYSDIQGGWGGTGNIDADPIFCEPDSGMFTLAENSPCLGTGQDGANMGTLGMGCEAILSTDVNTIIPSTFTLHQNYPNPFNPATTIQYDLPRRAKVTLTIYDILGREEVVLINREQGPGYQSVIWNGRNERGQPVSTGVYLYRLQTGPPTSKFTETRKLVLLR